MGTVLSYRPNQAPELVKAAARSVVQNPGAFRMSATTSSDFARAMVPIAIEIMGKPNDALSSKDELRWGNRGSFSVDTKKGTWHNHEAGEGGGVLDFLRERKNLDKPDALDFLRERRFLPPETIGGKPIVATYGYHDEAGKLLFQVVRLDPKDFRQRAPDGKGGWVWKMDGVRKVLYHLPRVLEAVKRGDAIYVCEGEKAVHAMEKHGFTATCSSGGCGKWKDPGYSKALAGARVVILADNDEAGIKHARQVERALHDRAWRVQTVFSFPNVPAKGDVHDYFANGGTAADFVQMLDDDRPRGWFDPMPAGWADEGEETNVDNGHNRSKVSDEITFDNIKGDKHPAPETSRQYEGAALEPEAQTSRQRDSIKQTVKLKNQAEPVEEARKEYHDLRAKLAKNANGAVLATHANMTLILKHDPLLADLAQFDAFSWGHMLRKPIPVVDRAIKPAAGPYPRPWTDADVTRLLSYVQKEWSASFKKGTVRECLLVEGMDNEIHPVRDWLAALNWDRSPRLSQWLQKAFGCADNDYNRAIGAKLLIAAARRVRQPGCKFDHMVVIEGLQGKGKSSVLQLLFSTPWFADDIADLATKDAAIGLLGKWCIEMGEIEKVIKAEVETVKAFLSRGTDHYRPPYGTVAVDVPRQSVLVGTTNAEQYLRDSTGNRRIWPVNARTPGMADFAWVRANRDQLWAEAAHYEAMGATIWLDEAALRQIADEAQADRMITDPWSDRVHNYLDQPGRKYARVPDVLEIALQLPPAQMTKPAEMRVADIFKLAKWSRDTRHVAEEGKTIKAWFPPPK
jgi:predicted P-loop ATPase